MWLPNSPWRPLLARVVEKYWFPLARSCSGGVFDLAVIPLLLWRPTRIYAYLAAVLFHLMNALVFNIGGVRRSANVGRWLDASQFNKMSRDPEMMREFAQFLGQEHQKSTAHKIQVLEQCSLNSRIPQLLIGPKFDLGNTERTIRPKTLDPPVDGTQAVV